MSAGNSLTPLTSRSAKWRAIAAWALRVIVGLAFLLIAATKLIGTAATVEYFEAIAWGQWFRYLTGSAAAKISRAIFDGWTPSSFGEAPPGFVQ
jgi:hypothetical protein